MTRRSGFFCLFLLFSLPSTSFALEMVWSTGSKDISVQSARTCTLVVGTLGGIDPLPSGWRLVWTALTDGAEPITLIPGIAAEGTANVCSVGTAWSPEYMISRVDTAAFCADNSFKRSAVAHLILKVPAAAVGKIKLLPENLLAEDSLATLRPEFLPEVTINGGLSSPYPPLLTSIFATRAGSAVSLTVRGAFLGSIRSICLAETTATIRAQFQILEQSDTWLKAQTSSLGRMSRGYVFVTDHAGQTSALLAPAAVLASTPTVPTDRFLVRFTAGQVEPSGGQSAGPLATFKSSNAALLDSLTSVGVTALERLLPWFEHGDVHSTNLLGEPVTLVDLADLYVAYVPPQADIATTVNRASLWPPVVYASCDFPIVTHTLPNDPLFPEQWNLSYTGTPVCEIYPTPFGTANLAAIWNHTQGSPAERIAILDTGIDATHLDFSGRVVLDTSFVPSASTALDDNLGRHGTAVAGIALASGNNGIGVAGAAWNAQPWAIKVIESAGAGYLSWWISGLDRCRVKRIPIVNMSLGIAGEGVSIDTLRAVNDACYNAFITGLLLVASSGNVPTVFDFESGYWGRDLNTEIFPAAFTNRVYAVGAVLPDGLRWRDADIAVELCRIDLPPPSNECWSSNYGPWLDIVAPGGRFVATTATGPNGYYSVAPSPICDADALIGTGFWGTSASAPLVSGVASLLRTIVPSLQGEDLAVVMNKTALSPYPGQKTEHLGWGILRAGHAFSYITPPNRVVHGYIFCGPQASNGDATVLDSMHVVREFINVPGVSNGYHNCWRYRVRVSYHGGLAPQLPQSPTVWVRASGTTGWRDPLVGPYDADVEVPWGQLISLGEGSAGPVFETFVYKILDVNGDPIGYFPDWPSKTTIAYTAVGFDPNVDVSDGMQSGEFGITVGPNPATAGSWITFSLPAPGEMRVQILDIAGRAIAQLADGHFDAGATRLFWNGRRESGAALPPGLYWCRAEFDGRILGKKLVLLGRRP